MSILQKGLINDTLYREHAHDIDVLAKYSFGETSDTLRWEDKTIRGLPPFNQIKVFDSSYLPIFLDERENLINIEPLGLHLFNIITKIMDEFTAEINTKIEKEQRNQPILQQLTDTIASQRLQNILRKKQLNNEDNALLGKIWKCDSHKLEKRLEQLKQRKQMLEKNNAQDTIKNLNRDKEDLLKLKAHLNKIKTEIESCFIESISKINSYNIKKQNRDQRKKELAVLNKIPAQHTKEWQNFVEAGKEYKNKIDVKDVCIYCQQTLTEKALELVNAYEQYLTDRSQTEFKAAANEICQLQEKVKLINTNFDFSDDLKKILNSEIILDSNKEDKEQEISLKFTIDNYIVVAKKQICFLKRILEKKQKPGKNEILMLDKIDHQLTKLINEKRASINVLSKDSSNKQIGIEKLITEISKREDIKKIKQQKENIIKYYAIFNKITQYENIVNKINTDSITRLGSKAHEKLLTVKLRDAFAEELVKLGQDNIAVTLKKIRGEKGKLITKLCINSNIKVNDVGEILSEGEQKAVGLALFLAEINTQQTNFPVVFDDPVTSLDHEIADYLAENLLKISLNKQIIIFTHNKLFYKSFDNKVRELKDNNNVRMFHICKNHHQEGCTSSKGKHIFTYKIDRKDRSNTGLIFKEENLNLSYFISKAKQELQEGNFKNASDSLRSAVEHYIDEKILNKQGLLKDRTSRSVNIKWEELKKVNPDHAIIDNLKNIYGQLSNRRSHLTAHSEEIPLSYQTLDSIIQQLEC